MFAKIGLPGRVVGNIVLVVVKQSQVNSGVAFLGQVAQVLRQRGLVNHQPQAVTWNIGKTLCRNVGYFRATGRVFEHDAG